MDKRINLDGKNDLVVTMNNDRGSFYLTVFVFREINDAVSTEIVTDVVTVVKETIMRELSQ